MFPTFGRSKPPENIKNEGTPVLVSLCPLGCICCIMQQFYQRRCWCREVKETHGTQTDPEDMEALASLVAQQLKGTSTVGTQTEAVKENLPPASQCDKAYNQSIDQHITSEMQRGIKMNVGSTDNQHSAGVKLVKINPAMAVSEKGRQGDQGQLKSQPKTLKAKELVPNKSNTTTTESNTNNTISDILPKYTTATVKCLQVQLMSPAVSAYQAAQTLPPANSLEKGPVPNRMQQVPLAALTHRYQARKHKMSNEPDAVWQKYATHGSTEQAELQVAINVIMDKYDLRGARDPNFEEALRELLSLFPALRESISSRMLLRSKLRHRISSRRHYSRIKTEANDIGVAVSALKRRKMEENALQHQILGETIVRNSLSQSPSALPAYHAGLLNTKLTSRPELDLPTTSGLKSEPLPHPSSQQSPTPVRRSSAPSEANNRLASVLSSHLTPPIAHTTASRDQIFASRRTIYRAVSSRDHAMTSSGGVGSVEGDRFKQECGDGVGVSTAEEEEALDLSDPRHDVIIKIEPIDDTGFVT